MPEFYDIPHEEQDITSRVEELLREQEHLTLQDMDNITVMMHIRLRSLLTVEQLHHRAHALIMIAEAMLRQPGAVTDPETGEPIPPVLVENFEGGADEVLAMTRSEKLTDEDIEAFYAQFGGGEEE